MIRSGILLLIVAVVIMTVPACSTTNVNAEVGGDIHINVDCPFNRQVVTP